MNVGYPRSNQWPEKCEISGILSRAIYRTGGIQVPWVWMLFLRTVPNAEIRLRGFTLIKRKQTTTGLTEIRKLFLLNFCYGQDLSAYKSHRALVFHNISQIFMSNVFLFEKCFKFYFCNLYSVTVVLIMWVNSPS